MGSAQHRAFDHVLIIMFENQYRSYVMQNPYMRSLAARGIDMANYFGCMHPSQTNYIASLAGELCNMTDDDPPPALLKQRTMVDLIEESPLDLSWKGYMDSYISSNTPWSPEMKPKDQFPYVIKHDPFSSFENIVCNRERWQKVQNEADFFADLLNGTLPNYAWFTPDMWNDGHYLDGTQKAPEERAPALVDQLAKWLEGFFAKLRFPGPHSHLPPNTLVVVTFDEADFESKYDEGKKYTYDGPNQIYTVLLGDSIEPGRQEEGYNHYSLIRTIEKNFGLNDLGKNDQHANWFRFLWNESFFWDLPTETPLVAPNGLAAATFADALHVVTSDEDGHLALHLFDCDTWLPPQALSFVGYQPNLQAVGDALFLTFTDSSSNLKYSQYTVQHGWSAEASLTTASTCASDMAETEDSQLMLAYATTDGALFSRTFSAGEWQAPVSIGFTTSGDLSLAQLGGTLLVIFQDKTQGGQLSAVSYNTADYNMVTYPEGSKYSGSYDDTCKNAWGKNAYPVAHFAHGPNTVTPGENEPLLQPYQGNAPLATATLDGVIHLLHPAQNNSQVVTETYSLSGIMTPKLPISYQASDQTTTSNGYGTLAEAGWSKQRPITGVLAKRILKATRYDDIVVVFHAVGQTIHMTQGGYSPLY